MSQISLMQNGILFAIKQSQFSGVRHCLAPFLLQQKGPVLFCIIKETHTGLSSWFSIGLHVTLKKPQVREMQS